MEFACFFPDHMASWPHGRGKKGRDGGDREGAQGGWHCHTSLSLPPPPLVSLIHCVPYRGFKAGLGCRRSNNSLTLGVSKLTIYVSTL